VDSALDFPQALKMRRELRRMSQLELAERAGTTQRHVSFMERGRSTPGRAMVVRLAEALQLPLRERNDLLHTAGYAAVYRSSPLADPALAPVRGALEHVLHGHLPYPAVVVDRFGDLVAANGAFDVLTEGVSAQLLAPPVNVYRLALHPRGMAPRIANFGQWSFHVVDRLQQELLHNPSERLARLHEELAGYVPDRVVPTDHLGFAVPVRLRSSRGELNLLTTVTTFATAVDVTLAELKLEAFLPADEATVVALREWRRD
jgi:transcriptional regulator with XRE-family HTH domain